MIYMNLLWNLLALWMCNWMLELWSPYYKWFVFYDHSGTALCTKKLHQMIVSCRRSSKTLKYRKGLLPLLHIILTPIYQESIVTVGDFWLGYLLTMNQKVAGGRRHWQSMFNSPTYQLINTRVKLPMRQLTHSDDRCRLFVGFHVMCQTRAIDAVGKRS